MPADIVLKNANVLTMDIEKPSAELVAITGDKILMVGSNADLDSVIGPETREIDCEGRAVLPGFNDAHLHFFSLMRKLLSVDLSPTEVSSIEDIKMAIRRKAEDTPPGTWLSGTDYNEFYLTEKRCPTRWDIDEAAPDHPVVLSHRSLHACVLNSLALSLAGINRETPEPPGARIERDLDTGEPNGILVEMLSYIRGTVMPPFSNEELEEAVVLANRHFLSHGITSFQDATYKNDLNRWGIFHKYQETGSLRTRISMMVGPDTWYQFSADGMVTGTGDNRLRLGAVKIMLGEAAGQDEYNQEELNRLVLDCHTAGFQVAFHAIAESAIESATTALEFVNEHSSIFGRRHRIEHCSESPDYLLERLKKLEAVIVTHPSAPYYGGDRYLATVKTSQLPWLYRIKTPVSHGLVMAAASDAPVMPVSPMAGLYGAVTRKTDSGQFLLREEAVSPLQAMQMYTVCGAYASFEEDSKGSIAPGKLADVVILSDDPAQVSSEEILKIKAEMTIIGGEVAWEA